MKKRIEKITVILLASFLLCSCGTKESDDITNPGEAIAETPDFDAVFSGKSTENTDIYSEEAENDDESREADNEADTVPEVEAPDAEITLKLDDVATVNKPDNKSENQNTADRHTSGAETNGVNNQTSAEQKTSVNSQTSAEQKPTVNNQTTTEKHTTTEKQTTTGVPSTTTGKLSADNGIFKTFSVNALDGRAFTQDIFTKADITIVITWTTWCGYCKMEMPVLEQILKEYSGKGVQVIGIAMDARSDYYISRARELVSQLGITYPCLMYNETIEDGYVSGISAYPTTVFVNRKGELINEITGSYAAYGDDYALDVYRTYLDYYLSQL